MGLNLQSAEPPRDFDAIPNGTMVKLRCEIMTAELKSPKSGNGNDYSEGTFVIVSSPYAGRKMFKNLTMKGSEKAVAISLSFLRGVVDGANGFRHDDDSDEALAARDLDCQSEIQTLEFAARISAKEERYTDASGAECVAIKNDFSPIAVTHTAYETAMNGETTVGTLAPNKAKQRGPGGVTRQHASDVTKGGTVDDLDDEIPFARLDGRTQFARSHGEYPLDI